MGLTVLPISPRKKKQYGRWWQNTISFSTSSSKSHPDDNVLDNRCILKSSLYSNNCRTTCNRSTRQLTRARKLRHLSDKEINLNQLSSESSPLPLPVPDVDNLLQRDAKSGAQRSNCGNVPLPSPREVHHRPVGGEEKEKQKLESLPDALGRLVAEDGNGSVDNTDNGSERRSHTQSNGKKGIPDDYQISFPNSAPCSPYSSPVRSPQVRPGDVSSTQIMSPPSIFQVWSAPEVPFSDPTLDPGFCYEGRHDSAAHNGDESSILGPGLSPPRSCKGSTEIAPPSLIKFPMETQLPRRDNNGQANGHPLPLPPGNPMPLPPCPAAQLPAKPDLVPIKSQWQKGKLIGRGTFGSVYVASNKETGALCGLKEVEILPDDPNSDECIRQLEQEIKVLSHLKHPNIVQYYGSERVGDRFYIYLEYVHPGSINKFIRDHCGAITESVVRNFTRHILCGLAYLHSTKTIHRDIKGANLLVDASGVVKLADFGMAKHLKGHAANLSLKGSPHWMAPELLQSDTYKDDWTDHALAIDIWSLGCTVIEMMNGKPPWSEYEGPAAMFKVLKETPPIPENLSVEGKDFLHCCFRRNPAERPTASMLLEHSFVKNPHPPDVTSGRQPIDEMKLPQDKLVKQGERLYKLDHIALSLDTESMKGKRVENLKQEPFSPLRFNYLSNKTANLLEMRPSRS